MFILTIIIFLSFDRTLRISELFGAAYVSLYDANNKYEGYFKFSLMKQFFLWGSRNAYNYDEKGRCLYSGQKQSAFTAMFTGRRRPVYFRSHNDTLTSKKVSCSLE